MGNVATGGFARRPKAVDPLIKYAPAELQKDLKEQDEDLDKIHEIVGDLGAQATAMVTTASSLNLHCRAKQLMGKLTKLKELQRG